MAGAVMMLGLLAALRRVWWLGLTLLWLPAAALPLSPPGWRWYDPVIAPTPSPPSLPAPAVPSTATATMASFQQYYAEVKHDAVLHPTDVAKLTRLLKLHQYVSNQATQFTLTAQQALLSTPSLQYSLRHPTQHAARWVYTQQQQQAQQRLLARLAADGYGLFFAYRGRDPLAQALAPSLRAFGEAHGLPVLGISLDGTLSAALIHNKINQGQLSLKADPAVLLVHPARGELQPVAYGWVTQSELIRQIQRVSQQFKPDI
jgi:conjugal transfer pilus assembly protein TraF